MRSLKYGLICIIFVPVAFVILLNWYFLDGLTGWFLSHQFKEDTIYSKGYNDASFRRVANGISENEVLKILGPPLGEVWAYGDGNYLTDLVSFTAGRVDRVIVGRYGQLGLIENEMNSEDVLKIAGTPLSKSWVYSKSPGDVSYRVRTIELHNGAVFNIKHYFYVD